MAQENFKLNPKQEQVLWEKPMSADSSEVGDLEYIARNLPDNLQVYRNEVLDLAQRLADKSPDMGSNIWLQKLDALVASQKQEEQKVLKDFASQLDEQTGTMSQEFSQSVDEFKAARQERQDRFEAEKAKIKAKFDQVALDEFKRKNTPHGFRFAMKAIWEAVTFVSARTAAHKDKWKMAELEQKFREMMSNEIEKLLQEYSRTEEQALQSWSKASFGSQTDHLEITLKRQQQRNAIIKKLGEDFRKALIDLENQAQGSGEDA